MSYNASYECDECGINIRRITLHVSEMPRASEFPAWEDMHFCGTLCMDDFIRHSINDQDVSELTDSGIYWLKGQDIRDGA